MKLEETTLKTNKIIILYEENEQGNRLVQLIAKEHYFKVYICLW